jgi:hypothetical protein
MKSDVVVVVVMIMMMNVVMMVEMEIKYDVWLNWDFSSQEYNLVSNLQQLVMFD